MAVDKHAIIGCSDTERVVLIVVNRAAGRIRLPIFFTLVSRDKMYWQLLCQVGLQPECILT